MIRRVMNWWRIEPMPEAHYATFYGVPVWFADVPPDGCSMAGRNQLYDRLLLVFTHLHNYLVAPFYDYGFPVRVGPRVESCDASTSVEARLQDIKEHPERHKHSFWDLQTCCMMDNSFHPLLMDAHPELGRNGGQKCDVTNGPCSCGAWH